MTLDHCERDALEIQDFIVLPPNKKRDWKTKCDSKPIHPENAILCHQERFQLITEDGELGQREIR